MIAVLPVTHFEQLFSKLRIENRGHITLRGKDLQYITHYPRTADCEFVLETEHHGNE